MWSHLSATLMKSDMQVLCIFRASCEQEGSSLLHERVLAAVWCINVCTETDVSQQTLERKDMTIDNLSQHFGGEMPQMTCIAEHCSYSILHR